MIQIFAVINNENGRGVGFALPVLLLSILLIFKFPNQAMRVYWIVVIVSLIALLITGVMYLETNDVSYGKAWVIIMVNLLAALIYMRELEKKK